MANHATNNPKDPHPQLREAILRYQSSQLDRDYQLIFQSVFQGEYLVVSDFVGQTVQEEGFVETLNQEVSIKTINGTLGEAMMAFTDTTSLIAYAGAEARYLTVNADMLLNWSLGPGLVGLVINPGSSTFFIDRDQVTTILQHYSRPSSFSSVSTPLEQIQNPELEKCLQEFNSKIGQGNDPYPDNFLTVLFESVLLLPMRGENGDFYVMTLKTSDGLSAFPAFTTVEASQVLSPTLNLVAFDFQSVLAMAVQYPCQYFVINPGPMQMEINMAEMKHLYERLRQTGEVPKHIIN